MSFIEPVQPMLALIPDSLRGEAAAVATAWCWVFTSLAFAAAGRRMGATAVNMMRLILAVILLGAVHMALHGTVLPAVDQTSLIYLLISGFIGLAIGDQLLFTALVDIGPRFSTLIMTLAPPIAAAIAWPVLDEPLAWLALLGMTITIGGIVWVVLERPRGDAPPISERDAFHRRRGIAFAFGGAVCQAVGLILSKIGFGHTRLPESDFLDPWSVTLLRMIAGAAGMMAFVILMRWRASRVEIDASMDLSTETVHLPPSIRRARDGQVLPAALGFTVVGAIFGPVLGVWLSMVAVNNAPAGIAATLMALSPVFILPLAVLVEKEKLTARAWIGACIAVVGVILLGLEGQRNEEPPMPADSGQVSDSSGPSSNPDEPRGTLDSR